jgi:hypothetical protein
MTVIQNIFGNSTQIGSTDAMPIIDGLILENEEVITAYKLWRDMIVFTSERLILIDVQGLTGKKISFESIPFSVIKKFKMENAGTLDFDAEITLTLQGSEIIPLKFAKGTDLKPIYLLLSKYILRDN